jgi:NADPH-dependent ferric siderophore reductase
LPGSTKISSSSSSILPDGATPSGFVYYLPNPTQNGALVSFDDCEKATGILFDFKGLSYARLTNDLPERMAYEFIEQATRQLAASGERPLVWIFAEEGAALFARKLFDSTSGLERITVGYIPWIGSAQ